MNRNDSVEAKANRQAQLRRGMFLLPSLFTAGNIGAGYFSITQTIAAIGGNGDAHIHLDWAAIAILFAIPFDALDGRIARMTNTASDFGKELDSLADVITFGVAPSLLAYVWGFYFLPDSINAQLASALAAGRRLHQLSFPDWRSFPPGAVQYQPRCAATQPGATGPEVFCGNADSSGGGHAGSDGPLLQCLSCGSVVGSDSVAASWLGFAAS